MTIPLPTITSPAPSVCKMLRTKNAYSRSNERDPNIKPWQFGQSTTAVFWCLKTMQPAGPDDNFAHASVCLSGRTCYCSTD
jgi:hypothetical protein